jgi:hypothetical protein
MSRGSIRELIWLLIPAGISVYYLGPGALVFWIGVPLLLWLLSRKER